MKKFLIYIVIVSVIVLGYFFIKSNNGSKLVSGLSLQQIYIQRDQTATFNTPDWTTDELITKINNFRVSMGLSKVTENTKLDQAAKARISVILSEQDYDGSITGITREKALESAGYDANLIGELVLIGFVKTSDPITYWESATTSKGTLAHTDFKDIGIAVKNSADKVDVYVLMASSRAVTKQVVTPTITWGGPDLWTAINKRRVELGVNPLKQMDFLCTIASIRLNQLLELGKLDGHEGFVPVLNRPDLKPEADKYNISEFLIQGYPTPSAAVAAWENTMGHKSLLAGGEYVWGCVYAQNTFGVAIAAY